MRKKALRLVRGIILSLSLVMTTAPLLGPVRADTITIDSIASGKDASQFGSALMQDIIVFATVLTLAYLIWGGIDWITSGGDKTKLEAAQGKLRHAVIGLAIIASVWAVYLLVLQVTFGKSDAVFSLPKLAN